jgi:hypothetical protein
LSTLTKVLIILLTTFSCLLCGVVVTYVAHADNQKQKAEQLQNDISAAKSSQQAAEKDQLAAKEAFEKREAELNEKITALNTTISDKEAEIAKLTQAKTEAEQNRDAQIARAQLQTETASASTKLYMDAQKKIDTLSSDQTSIKKELEELNVLLAEKMSLVAQFEEKNKQLTEANQDLSNRLNDYLQKYGRMAAAPQVATPNTGIATPAAPKQEREISLKGKVVNVDLQNSVAQVSLGSASGVKQNMTFHVLRGDQFICDIVIQSVDPDKAIGKLGYLDRNRAEPRAGDVVSTNL